MFVMGLLSSFLCLILRIKDITRSVTAYPAEAADSDSVLLKFSKRQKLRPENTLLACTFHAFPLSKKPLCVFQDGE